MKTITWAYGVTTVPERRASLLPQTLTSLAAAGFDKPRLFVDGTQRREDYQCWEGLEVTLRAPRIRAYGNWILALAELYIRQPTCHRYALFQDDVITYPNLRPYLDGCRFPEKGFWNLYTTPSNEELRPKDWDGWYAANQLCKGALGLVFDREGVQALLTHQHMIMKPAAAYRPVSNVDGAVSEAMRAAGYREWVHWPSLVQHTGMHSTMGSPYYRPAQSFRGVTCNALSLRKERS